MPAPAIGHLICTMVLVALILLMPTFYGIAINNIRLEMLKRELKEVTDYVSNTLENLYFLVNSTSCIDVSLEKELIYMPTLIENSFYVLSISKNGANAQNVTAYLTDNISVSAVAWLSPGLKWKASNSIVSSGRKVVAGCSRNVTGIYVWIREMT